MGFLDKFDIGQIIGLIFIFTAVTDKFLIQDILLNRMVKSSDHNEEELKRIKKIFTIGINVSAVICAVAGVIFLFGFVKI